MLGWWMILYYPILRLIFYIGNRIEKRKGVTRKTDMMLGCAFMRVVGLPIFVNVLLIVYRAFK
jgi:hypothetical protein